MKLSPAASVPFRALRREPTLTRLVAASYRVSSPTMAIGLFLQFFARLLNLLFGFEISLREGCFGKNYLFFENEANNILKTKG